MILRLELEEAKVQNILNILGDMPNKSNTFPLMMEILNQARACSSAGPVTSEPGTLKSPAPAESA